MRNSVLSIILVMSAGTVSFALHTSDTIITPPQYTFNEFDKHIFTNSITKKVELVYPTPLIESISSEFITIQKWDFEGLLHPALTRIVYKQKELGFKNFHGLNDVLQKESMKKPFEKEINNYTQLHKLYTKIQAMASLVDSNSSDVKIPMNDFMLLVQYAAQKIHHEPYGISIIVSKENNFQIFPYGPLYQLINTYRAHEQQ